MTMSATLARLFGRATDPDDELEDRQAARLDANLTKLIATDPDAAQIFPAGAFTAARRSRRAMDQLATQIEQYAAAKLAAGRMDLYHNGLFSGVED